MKKETDGEGWRRKEDKNGRRQEDKKEGDGWRRRQQVVVKVVMVLPSP
jgi:hypothetical protein